MSLSHLLRCRVPLTAAAALALTGSTCAVLVWTGSATHAATVQLQVAGQPLSGLTVAGAATVELPDPTAAAVTWVLDGVYQGRDTRAPFQLSLRVGPGEHRLKARSSTATGTRTTYEVRFRASAPVSPAPSPVVPTAPLPTGSPGTPPPTTAPAPTASVRSVRTAGELTAALAAATPGQVVQLADGTYRGRFAISTAGTAAAPVTLRGGRGAVLEGGEVSTGYALHLDGARHWRLEGFTVRGAQKGIVLDRSNHVVMKALDVGGSGMEAVHFRSASSDNRLEQSLVHDTGRYEPGYGEGVYIGSATSNWARYGGGGPDRSDRNTVVGNRIWATTAESVDIKEGTTGGLVSGNSFDGAGITGAHFGDSWIDLKGNGYRVSANRGVRSPRDGFQTHVQLAGWGRDNVFSANDLVVDGPGHGILVDEASTSGNTVTCDNRVTGAARGLSNLPCR